jgi:hypothetical protein
VCDTASDEPRAKRFGRWVIGAIVVVVLGVASGVIATPILVIATPILR